MVSLSAFSGSNVGATDLSFWCDVNVQLGIWRPARCHLTGKDLQIIMKDFFFLMEFISLPTGVFLK